MEQPAQTFIQQESESAQPPLQRQENSQSAQTKEQSQDDSVKVGTPSQQTTVQDVLPSQPPDMQTLLVAALQSVSQPQSQQQPQLQSQPATTSTIAPTEQPQTPQPKPVTDQTKLPAAASPYKYDLRRLLPQESSTSLNIINCLTAFTGMCSLLAYFTPPKTPKY